MPNSPVPRKFPDGPAATGKPPDVRTFPVPGASRPRLRRNGRFGSIRSAMNGKPQPISIGADGVDAEKIVGEILARVAERRAQGAYDDETAARAERNNILTMKDDEEFLDRYLACLRQVVPVDINDFPIVERRSFFAPLSKAVKKVLWKLLKFYTFRLWSQQNQTNGVLLAAIETMHRRHKAETDALKARIAALENKG